LIKETKEGLLLSVKVKPKSHKDEVEGVENDYLKVRIRAAPEKGNANDSLIETLSLFFGIPKSHIEIASGATSRIKKILIPLKYMFIIKEKLKSDLSQ